MLELCHAPRAKRSDAKKFPTTGTSPAKTMQSAPVIIVNLFTTLVMAISPTFCENEVTGEQLKSDENAEAKPSHASEPETSSSVIFLPSPPIVIAEVSPIVSAAETRKIIQTDKIAPT